MYSMLNIICLLVVSVRIFRSLYTTTKLQQAVFEGRNVFIIPLALAVAKSKVSANSPPLSRTDSNEQFTQA